MKLLRLRLAGLCLLGGCILLAQDWKTADTLPGIDLTSLTTAQKAAALKILREHGCSCGCNMKLAECRVVDPNCSFSKGLAAAVVDALRQGKSEADAIAAADASKWAHTQPTRLLDDPVSIPTSGAPVLGPANAPVTLVEFSDFQCPYCIAAVPEIKALLEAYPTQVKLIFKQYPLDIHSRAEFAATAAIAAHQQGKFWALHDAMFATRNLSRDNILTLAQKAGLDMKRFESDLDSTLVRETILRDIQDGDRAGVEGTPTLFVNGKRYNGPIVENTLKPVLEAELRSKPAARQTASVK
ncbi:MAG: thioredoxin domain-containing protein [Acidobacteriaceae bacterium]|nr:thioredoxin domain-containing protein [Acidobacteriaceae bacterium]